MPSSDVQVFVRFKERCVFAGEEVSCTITFKNVADATEPPPTPRIVKQNGHGRVISLGRTQYPQRPIHDRQPSRSLHKASFSLSSPPLPKDFHRGTPAQRPDFSHHRSVSIVSVGSPSLSAPLTSLEQTGGRNSPHSELGHRRSSTVHLVGDTSLTNRFNDQELSDLRVLGRNARRSPLSVSHTPPSESQIPDFKFSLDNQSAQISQSVSATPNLGNKSIRQSRVVSSTNNVVDVRNSTDIYTQSNHSAETLTSEQASMISERPHFNNHVTKQLQRTNSLATRRRPEMVKLIMGYAQVSATFILDASLVDQTPFEEVKKKGFLGGQAGGGVVGVKKKTRPNSGLFGAFNFSSIGESLESLMGGDNLSSVKEMKAVTSSRAIPLLSTPQSLLFVDLQLEPGDEKSFYFSYKLPKGLPSSYKGKAIKIAYNLTIGVQGDPGRKEMRAVRQVNIPIRVFSGVDRDGEIFGHDLMQPYVVLKDNATARAIERIEDESKAPLDTKDDDKITQEDFLKNIDTLLDRKRRRQSSTGTLDTMFMIDDNGGSPTIRAIKKAIMFSNQASTDDSSSNKFEIARNGLAIATVILDRPLHRLGETVTTVIDLSSSQMTCASLRATLETTERVTGSLAVRSASAVTRITRKVYASQAENTLFADRVVFSPTIPASATPTFVTSGVNLDWYIKLEFGTVRSEDVDGAKVKRPALVEEIMNDERGTVNIAVESLGCDTFEVSIPITVYGDMVVDGKDGGEVNGIPI